MRSKDNSVDPTRVMELAFENILDEIIEHVIEGICFEAHRAVKLGYFPVYEYVYNEEGKLEIYQENPSSKDPESDIFGNNEKSVKQLKSACPRCGIVKGTQYMLKHFIKCRPNNYGSDKTEIEDEDDSNDYDSFERKKGNDTKRQTKSALKYDNMSEDQKQDFLKKCCGVVSKHTGIPCKNSLGCKKHTMEDKDIVRGINRVLEIPDPLVDGNIDPDTVD